MSKTITKIYCCPEPGGITVYGAKVTRPVATEVADAATV